MKNARGTLVRNLVAVGVPAQLLVGCGSDVLAPNNSDAAAPDAGPSSSGGAQDARPLVEVDANLQAKDVAAWADGALALDVARAPIGDADVARLVDAVMSDGVSRSNDGGARDMGGSTIDAVPGDGAWAEADVPADAPSSPLWKDAAGPDVPRPPFPYVPDGAIFDLPPSSDANGRLPAWAVAGCPNGLLDVVTWRDTSTIAWTASVDLAQRDRYTQCVQDAAAQGGGATSYISACAALCSQLSPPNWSYTLNSFVGFLCDYDAGLVGVQCKGSAYGPAGGRRPETLQFASNGTGGSALGRHFAHLAQLEAASVPAFLALERELMAHGAPREMIAGARLAARQEVRHYKVMVALARRYGVSSELPRVGPQAVRSMQAVAEDNAVEGCTRETYAAAELAEVARTSADAVVRGTLHLVAREERAHGELSRRIHGWIRDRLPARGRRQLEERGRAERARLLAELSRDDDRRRRALGLPSATRAADLARALV